MKAFVLVNSGLEKVAVKELSELLGVKGKINCSIVEFEIKKKEDLNLLASQGQSFRKLLVELNKVSDLSKVKFDFDWKDHFSKGMSFKVEVEGVSGNEKRLKIGKEIGSKVFVSVKEQLGFDPNIDMKKPDIKILVYFNGKDYFVGLDVCGFDLAGRKYRVFTNPSSFKGDLAYYFVRQSEFTRGEKLVVGFVKDGTIAIEAALFASGSIYGFDDSMMNLNAAKKNAKIAGVAEMIKFNKFDLDELDVKFSKNEINRLIVQLTKKDEDKLNELYYQASHVLKKRGTLLIICRESWDLTISDKFKLISKEKIKRGDSKHQVLLLEKK